MNRRAMLVVAMGLFLLAAIGCSGGSSPVSPSGPGDLSAAVNPGTVQDHLWGYFDVYIDVPTNTITATLDRTGMFSANVVTFLTKPTSLAFPMLMTTPVGTTAVDVDLDVAITHPLPVALYDGYDVRGIFIGDQNHTMKFNSAYKNATPTGTPAVQYMYDYDLTASDPHTGVTGMPDGYTRWWNPTEFTTTGVVGYTPGMLATKGYQGSATLNPYKYFAEGLNATDDAAAFLKTATGLTNHGKFKANTTLTRNYYLRFPLGAGVVGVKFNYAVLACWTGEANANAREAVAADATVIPELYYTNNTERGGDLKFDANLYGWGAQPSSITVESNLLPTDYIYTPPVATGGAANYSTYHVEVPVADADILSTGGNEFWVIAKYDNLTYNEGLGATVPSGALTAFFRYDLYVSPVSYNKPPTAALATPAAAMGWVGQGVQIVFDASGTTDPDAGDTLTYTWDFNDDGTYGDAKDGGTDVMPMKKFFSPAPAKVGVKVTDSKGAFSTASANISVSFKTVPKAKVLSLTSTYDYIYDQCIDPTTGDCLLFVYDGYYGQYHYVRRYKMSDGYTTYTTIALNTTNWPSYYYWDSPGTIDCDTKGNWSLGSGYPEYNGGTGQYGIRTSTFDKTDTFIASKWVALPASFYTYYNQGDICTMGDNTGTRANDVVSTFAWCTTWTSWYADMYTWSTGRQDTAYTSTWSSTYHNSGTGQAGANYLDMQVFKATEGDPNGDSIWYLKSGSVYNGSSSTNDYRAVKMDVSGTTIGSAAVTCGTGNNTTSDTGWTSECYDITIGEQGTVYVLDMWGTSYPQYTMRVKAFDETNGTSLGGANVSTTIYYPYSYYSALDGSDSRGFLTVTTASTYNWPYTWYLWVMTDNEVPPS